MKVLLPLVAALALTGCATFGGSKEKAQETAHKVVDAGFSAWEIGESLVSSALDAGKDLYCQVVGCDETPPAP